MFLNIKEMELRKIRFDEDFEPGEIDFLGTGLRQVSPIHTEGSAKVLENSGGEVRIQGKFSGTMEADCDRCLTVASLQLALAIVHRLGLPWAVASALGACCFVIPPNFPGGIIYATATAVVLARSLQSAEVGDHGEEPQRRRSWRERMQQAESVDRSGALLWTPAACCNKRKRYCNIPLKMQ